MPAPDDKFGANTSIWSAAFGPSEFHLLPEIKANGFDGIEVPILDRRSEGRRREDSCGADVHTGWVLDWRAPHIRGVEVGGRQLAAPGTLCQCRGDRHRARAAEQVRDVLPQHGLTNAIAVRSASATSCRSARAGAS